MNMNLFKKAQRNISRKKTLRDEYPANQQPDTEDPQETKPKRKEKKVISIDEDGNVSERIIDEKENPSD